MGICLAFEKFSNLCVVAPFTKHASPWACNRVCQAPRTLHERRSYPFTLAKTQEKYPKLTNSASECGAAPRPARPPQPRLVRCRKTRTLGGGILLREVAVSDRGRVGSGSSSTRCGAPPSLSSRSSSLCSPRPAPIAPGQRCVGHQSSGRRRCLQPRATRQAQAKQPRVGLCPQRFRSSTMWPALASSRSRPAWRLASGIGWVPAIAVCIALGIISGFTFYLLDPMGASLLAAAEAATALATSQWEPAPSHWEGCDFPVGASQIPLGK